MSRHRGMTGKGGRNMTGFGDSEEAARVAAYMSSINSERVPATTQPEDRYSPRGAYDVIRRVTSPDHEGQRNTAVALGRALAGRGLRKKVTVTEPSELCIVIFEGVRDLPQQVSKRSSKAIRDELDYAVLRANEAFPMLSATICGSLIIYKSGRQQHMGIPYDAQDLQNDRAGVGQNILTTTEGRLFLRTNVRAVAALGETAVSIPPPTLATLSSATHPYFAPGAVLQCGELEVVPSLR